MFDLTLLDELIDHKPSPEYTKAAALVEPYVQKIISLTGIEFYGTFIDLYRNKLRIDADDYFTADLRLGAQLTIALLQPPPKIPLP